MDIGKIIRLLRGNMTQAELSTRSGVDKAIISKVETGKMPGTIECHKRLAAAFGLTLSQLYAYIEEKPQPAEFHSGSQSTDVYQKFLEILTSIPLSKKMLPTCIVLMPGEERFLEETVKKVERFLIVIKGKIEVEIENAIYVLEKRNEDEKGDSIYSRSPKRHRIKNIGTQKAMALCVSAPPVL